MKHTTSRTMGTALDFQFPTNPFVNSVKLGFKKKIQVAIMSLFVAPVRLLLMILSVLMAYAVGLVILFEFKEGESNGPLKGWRRRGKDLCAQLFVFAFKVAGFHKVKVKGRMASASEAPIIVAAPHSSFWDVLPYVFIGAPSVVSKSEVLDYPIIGPLMRLLEPIIVNRDSSDSRKATIDAIQQRAKQILGDKNGDWPSVLVFPEGTTTNRTQLIAFKLGAFYPRVPVQPMCIKWTGSGSTDLISWTHDGAGALKLIWLSLCEMETGLEIEFLPTHYPSAEEKEDVALFAHNVRRRMAECLGIPLGNYSLEDAHYITHNGTPHRHRLISLCEKLQVSHSTHALHRLRCGWDVLKKERRSFQVSYANFSHFLQTPHCDLLWRLFLIFDWKSRRIIDLREFLVARHAAPEHEEFLPLCFQIFSESKRGTVDEDSLTMILRIPFQMSRRKISKLIAKLHRNYKRLDYENVSNHLDLKHPGHRRRISC